MEVVVRFTRPSNSEAGAIPLQARSNRSPGKPQRSHIICFFQISDTVDDEDDGVEYDFRWQAAGGYTTSYRLGSREYDWSDF